MEERFAGVDSGGILVMNGFLPLKAADLHDYFVSGWISSSSSSGRGRDTVGIAWMLLTDFPLLFPVKLNWCSYYDSHIVMMHRECGLLLLLLPGGTLFESFITAACVAVTCKLIKRPWLVGKTSDKWREFAFSRCRRVFVRVRTARTTILAQSGAEIRVNPSRGWSQSTLNMSVTGRNASLCIDYVRRDMKWGFVPVSSRVSCARGCVHIRRGD